MAQIIYPLDSGGYKMGWLEMRVKFKNKEGVKFNEKSEKLAEYFACDLLVSGTMVSVQTSAGNYNLLRL